jgi:uncharacterized SAM-binding protein YcdF (DUF218 family)
VCLAVLGGLLLVFIAPGWVLPPLARYLDVSEEPGPVDYVLVLNGDPETRPFAAAALVKAGLARQVLLTRQRLALESNLVQGGAMLSELEITRGVLKARGVPEQAIRVLPGEISSTADEARVLAAFLKDEPEARVAVVTNGFHTRRARWIFRRALGEGGERIQLVGVPHEGVDEQSWWRTSLGCVLYVSEYAKLVYYRLRY